MTLLSGGFHRCTPMWDKEIIVKENCYKIYFLVKGNARIFADGEWFLLETGNAYFINGFLLEKQICDDFMEVYWLHFVPESPFLNMHFNHSKAVFSWKKESPLIISIDYSKIPFLFDEPFSENSRLMTVQTLSLRCYINSIILMLISDLLGEDEPTIDESSYPLYVKLSPAIEFINQNYPLDLKLEEISQKAYLNPIYFSRLFKKCFKMSPVRYMNMIRLNEASRLLTTTAQSVLEISEKTGFCNQFYFSKVFKAHFRKTPLEYRYTKFSP